MKIKVFVVKSYIWLLLFSGLFAMLHIYLLNNHLPKEFSDGPYWAIYLFLVPFTLITIFITALKYSIDETSAGKTYLSLVATKIVLTIAFFYPWLFPKTDFSVPLVKQFFALFFPLLFIELKVLIKLLNTSFDKYKKNDENQ